MKFTDKQLMLYVDGGLDKKTIKKIETALKKDKSLMERISVFQIANDAMLQHADETMKMPAELFEQLREIALMLVQQVAQQKAASAWMANRATESENAKLEMLAEVIRRRAAEGSDPTPQTD